MTGKSQKQNACVDTNFCPRPQRRSTTGIPFKLVATHPFRWGRHEFESAGGGISKFNFLGYKWGFCCRTNVNIARKSQIYWERQLGGAVLSDPLSWLFHAGHNCARQTWLTRLFLIGQRNESQNQCMLFPHFGQTRTWKWAPALFVNVYSVRISGVPSTPRNGMTRVNPCVLQACFTPLVSLRQHDAHPRIPIY